MPPEAIYKGLYACSGQSSATGKHAGHALLVKHRCCIALRWQQDASQARDSASTNTVCGAYRDLYCTQPALNRSKPTCGPFKGHTLPGSGSSARTSNTD